MHAQRSVQTCFFLGRMQEPCDSGEMCLSTPSRIEHQATSCHTPLCLAKHFYIARGQAQVQKRYAEPYMPSGGGGGWANPSPAPMLYKEGMSGWQVPKAPEMQRIGEAQGRAAARGERRENPHTPPPRGDAVRDRSSPSAESGRQRRVGVVGRKALGREGEGGWVRGCR